MAEEELKKAETQEEAEPGKEEKEKKPKKRGRFRFFRLGCFFLLVFFFVSLSALHVTRVFTFKQAFRSVPFGAMSRVVSKVPGVGKPFSKQFQRLARKQKEAAPWEIQEQEIQTQWREIDEQKKQIINEKGTLKKQQNRIEQHRLSLEQMALRLKKEKERKVPVVPTIAVPAYSEENLSRLSKIYAGMDPENAVKVLNSMPDELVIEIFRRMRESQVSDILSVMDAKKAGRLSVRLGKGTPS